MWINKCLAHASHLLIKRSRHHASIFENITHFTNKLEHLYLYVAKCMNTFVGSFVRTQWWLRHSNFTLDISISMYFALCILSVAVQHLGRSMGSVPVILWFCFTLAHSHFHWNFHSICRLTSSFFLLYTLYTQRIMYKMHDFTICVHTVQYIIYAYLPMHDKNRHWTHWRVRCFPI